MRVVEEDLVDWDPLVMRFIFKSPVGIGRREALAAFIDEWFATKTRAWLTASEAGGPPQIFVEYFGSTTSGYNAVEASANRLLLDWVQNLTEAVERSFLDVDHLRLGVSIAGPTVRSGFEWVHVPQGEVALRGTLIPIGDVDIALHKVSVGQFREFMDEPSYRPARARAKGDGSLMGYMRINYGSPKVPVHGVSYGDALAYCKWTGLRLPSEAEIYALFLAKARDSYQFMWGGLCWTADTEQDGTIVTCEGPYYAAWQRTPTRENRRECHLRDHYGDPLICFHVAK